MIRLDFDIDGGFSPPKAESTKYSQRIGSQLIYPEYSIILMVEVGNGMSVEDQQFQSYYDQIKTSLTTGVPVVGVIGYYDFPWQSYRMISDDKTLVLMYATIAGSITNEKLNKVANVTPLKVYVGGAVPAGQEMSSEILKGVETAEFGSLPILLFLLVLSLGSLVAGVMPFYGEC